MELSAKKIASMIDGVVEGNDQAIADKLSKIENGEKKSISFLGNPKYNNYLYSSKSSIILIALIDSQISKSIVILFNDNW